MCKLRSPKLYSIVFQTSRIFHLIFHIRRIYVKTFLKQAPKPRRHSSIPRHRQFIGWYKLPRVSESFQLFENILESFGSFGALIIKHNDEMDLAPFTCKRHQPSARCLAETVGWNIVIIIGQSKNSFQTDSILERFHLLTRRSLSVSQSEFKFPNGINS